MSENNVMVFIEQHDKQIAEVSIELVCKAAELAKKLGVSAEAIAIGSDMKKELEALGSYGCKTCYYVNDKQLANFTSIPYAKTIANAIKTHKPQIVLFGATTTGRDVAPRVASELKVGLTADCTDLQIGDHELKDQKWTNILYQIRPAFGGNIIATIVSPEHRPQMATVREGVMKMTEPDKKGKVEIVEEKHALKPEDFMSEIIEIFKAEKTVNLKAAQIIVSGGMGVGSKENFKLILELAETLGATVGASRAAVDAGFIGREHQVGQTGTTVRPKLYIACGISGQIQHRAGMMESKRIIAINSDPNAPLFDIAHYGIVGDINDVIPKMIKAYKAKA